jgi:biotin transport system substrate-specific component
MKTRDVARAGLFVALMAVCSWISIPAAVPFTLQTFAVFLAVGALGGKRGTLAVLAYILLGALGVPVFAGFAGGVGALLGPTGGYLIGFLAASLVVWALTGAPGGGIVRLSLAMLAGLFVLYAFGTAWFMVVYARANGAVPLATVLSWCVFPFILPDVLKIALAALLARRLRKAGI